MGGQKSLAVSGVAMNTRVPQPRGAAHGGSNPACRSLAEAAERTGREYHYLRRTCVTLARLAVLDRGNLSARRNAGARLGVVLTRPGRDDEVGSGSSAASRTLKLRQTETLDIPVAVATADLRPSRWHDALVTNWWGDSCDNLVFVVDDSAKRDPVPPRRRVMEPASVGANEVPMAEAPMPHEADP
jgi:hypothetical protein